MSASNDMSREDQALDALIAAALRSEGGDDLTLDELLKDEEYLTDEDRQILDALPSELATRLLAGESIASRKVSSKAQDAVEDDCLATAMNRGGDNGDLTEKAREEIERRIREDQNEDKESDTDEDASAK